MALAADGTGLVDNLERLREESELVRFTFMHSSVRLRLGVIAPIDCSNWKRTVIEACPPREFGELGFLLLKI